MIGKIGLHNYISVEKIKVMELLDNEILQDDVEPIAFEKVRKFIIKEKEESLASSKS